MSNSPTGVPAAAQKCLWLGAVVLALFLTASAGGSAAAGGADADASQGILVAFHDHVPAPARVNAVRRVGLVQDRKLTSPYFARLQPPTSAGFGPLGVGRVIDALLADPAVRIAEPDGLGAYTFVPNDPRFDEQWSLLNSGQTGGTPGADIGAVPAWDRRRSAAGILVAVIDSGVDYNHPDLQANIARRTDGSVLGWNFEHNHDDPMDQNSHGTHVAGIIGARGDNGIGIAGVCHEVGLMPLSIGTSAPTLSRAIAATHFAIDHGAHVTNNSYSVGHSALFLEAIQRARDAGILVVVAAGNSNINNDNASVFPANYSLQSDNVVTVASTTHSDTRSSFSSYGASTVHLGAPGSNILSTILSSSYGDKSGTSMAAPMVTGAYALLRAHAPDAGLDLWKHGILDTVTPLAALTGITRTGGRLNLDAATSGSLQLIQPDGGEKLPWGRPFEIRWSSTPMDGTVLIELSRDGGATFSHVIAPAAPDTGRFVWTPERGLDTEQARIRITGQSAPLRSASSASDFTLQLSRGIGAGAR
jgi:subtilisin family serine protease